MSVPALILLYAGVILNLVHLLLRHLKVYDKLRAPEWLQGFISGVAVGLILLAVIVTLLGPESLEAIKAWKQGLFGG